MFTGLVDAIGVLRTAVRTEAGLELVIESPYRDLVTGESIAVNGACLTVREHSTDSFSVAAVVTTMERTAIGYWVVGTRVNLERALRVGDRLGGHMVQGHVDTVGTVVGAIRRDDAVLLTVALDDDIWELQAPLGSVTIDGVSLTVNRLPGRGTLEVSIIDYTLSHTTLGELEPGTPVHVEADIIAKHVRRMLAPYAAAAGAQHGSG